MPLYTQPKSESYSNIQILECVAKKSHDPHRWKMTPPVENDLRPPSVEMRSIEEIRKETPTVEISSRILRSELTFLRSEQINY
jgi:hypothetical protein